MLNALVLDNFCHDRLKTTIHVSVLSLEVAMLLVAVGLRRGIALDPNPIRISFGAFVLVLLYFLIAIAFCFGLVEKRASVSERTQEFAILKMLGASSKSLCVLLTKETVLAAIPATVAGILLALFSKWMIACLLAHFLFQAPVYRWWPIAFIVVASFDLFAALLALQGFLKRDLLGALLSEE